MSCFGADRGERERRRPPSMGINVDAQNLRLILPKRAHGQAYLKTRSCLCQLLSTTGAGKEQGRYP